MSEFTPTRSLAIALADERRTMREGYAFLDEKCLLLAGEMLREVRQWQQRQRSFRAAWREAQTILRAAIARHGLQGLQLYPAIALVGPLATQRRTLLGVTMQTAALTQPTPQPASQPTSPPVSPPASTSTAATSSAAAMAPEPAVAPSPEAEACRRAFAALLPQLAEMAALSGNLARLHAEYKRTVRRVRALQDVLLPEIEGTLAAVEASLEELEQDEAAILRRVATEAAQIRSR